MNTDDVPDDDCVFVGNLPFDCSEEEVYDVFSSCGNVKEVRMPFDREANRLKGFAFVSMESPMAARKACDMNEQADIRGRKLRINLSTSKRSSPPSRNGRGGFRGRGNSTGGFRGDFRGRGSFRGGHGGPTPQKVAFQTPQQQNSKIRFDVDE
ncbi:RNA-binding protein [Galdieria sulphuraria]|uniref:RNA-binding protein n=1 Tax=Galdieria sulphuraria TaxID=130081 RepID=M2Y973_GALSU|nr:RNA-binding protein [Galdieria sulphuraria]EME32394.1 RNA-binding protein [Galdieria sulphuraria]|eukprot:XP_005708914.1 RNA-binding protein [Galdieria sulphuraria]